MSDRLRIGLALAALVGLFLLGYAATTTMFTTLGVRLNEHLVAWRCEPLTALAVSATAAASATVGVTSAILVPAALWWRRRRRAALHAVTLIGGSLAIALVAKIVIDEHRPPAHLWVIAPDNPHSFPSGHTTVASALALLAIYLVSARWQRWAAVIGVFFVGVVAFSRVYLGVHYLIDVVGGMLAASTATLLTIGLLNTSVVRKRFLGEHNHQATSGI